MRTTLTALSSQPVLELSPVKARLHFRLPPKRSNKPRRLPQTLNRRNMPSAAAAVPSPSAIVNSWSAITPATPIGLGRNGRLTTQLITALPRQSVAWLRQER